MSIELRRKEKNIEDRSDIEAVIAASFYCRVAMSDGNTPYIVPLCFGYKDNTLYFHSAIKGRKISVLQQNPQVCIQFDCDLALQPAEKACEWGLAYKSVIGFGRASFVEDPQARQEALALIMAHYTTEKFDFEETVLRKTLVVRVDFDELTGKQAV